MKLKLPIFVLIMQAFLCAHGQGFVNLNFEGAKFTTYLFGNPSVYASNAIPGWTPYIGGFAQDYVISNGASLGGAQINIEGTNNPFSYPPIQGKYFMLLQGSFGSGSSASIGQTGIIPASALSLVFWGSGGSVSFNSQMLSLVSLGSTNGFGIWGADVSVFAGQTGELLFTAVNGNTFNQPTSGGYYPGQGVILDNIQFSSTAVPEPSTLALLGAGATLFGLRRLKATK